MINKRSNKFKKQDVNLIKEKEWSKDYKFWLPLIISVLIAFNVFSPFSPKIFTSGAYIISPHLVDEPNISIPVFLIPMEFINTGNGVGVIYDIYLQVKKGNHESKYLPKYEVSLTNFIKYPENIQKIAEKPFQPFGLGKETISKNIMFVPNLNGDPIKLEPGEYIISVYAKSSRILNPVLVTSFSVIIYEQLMDSISSDDEVIFLRPDGGYDTFPIIKDNKDN